MEPFFFLITLKYTVCSTHTTFPWGRASRTAGSALTTNLKLLKHSVKKGYPIKCFTLENWLCLENSFFRTREVTVALLTSIVASTSLKCRLMQIGVTMA